MSYRLCWLLASRIRIPLASSQLNLYDIYLLPCVQCWTPYDGQRNCLKYVEFYSKNKFEKLVHLVGFIIIIYHNAWSSECQKLNFTCQKSHIWQNCQNTFLLLLHLLYLLKYEYKLYSSMVGSSIPIISE